MLLMAQSHVEMKPEHKMFPLHCKPVSEYAWNLANKEEGIFLKQGLDKVVLIMTKSKLPRPFYTIITIRKIWVTVVAKHIQCCLASNRANAHTLIGRQCIYPGFHIRRAYNLAIFLQGGYRQGVYLTDINTLTAPSIMVMIKFTLELSSCNTHIFKHRTWECNGMQQSHVLQAQASTVIYD